jgi:hypothetical protein
MSDAFGLSSPRNFPAEAGRSQAMLTCSECRNIFLGPVEFGAAIKVCRLCVQEHSRVIMRRHSHFGAPAPKESEAPPTPLQAALYKQANQEIKRAASEGLYQQILEIPQAPPVKPNPLLRIDLETFDLIVEALGREPVATEDDDLLSELMYLKETQLGK